MILTDDFEGERRRMSVKTRSENGKQEYKKRCETVEWPFGDIKQNLGLREFLTRGIENVRTEHNLVCSAHNMKVLWAKLRRNVTVLSNIWGLAANSTSDTSIFLELRLILNLRRLLRLNC